MSNVLNLRIERGAINRLSMVDLARSLRLRAAGINVPGRKLDAYRRDLADIVTIASRMLELIDEEPGARPSFRCGECGRENLADFPDMLAGTCTRGGRCPVRQARKFDEAKA